MLFKKYFLHQAIKNKKAKVRKLSDLYFLFDPLIDVLFDYSDRILKRDCVEIFSEFATKILSNHNKMNRILDFLIENSRITNGSSRYRLNFTEFCGVFIDITDENRDIFNKYAMLENLKFFPKIVTIIEIKDFKKFLIIFESKKIMEEWVNNYVSYNYIFALRILHDAKLIYDAGLSLKNFNIIKYKNIPSGINERKILALKSIGIKEKNDTFEEFSRNLLIDYFSTDHLGKRGNNKFEDSYYPFEFSYTISKELFFALKEEEISNIDFRDLLIKTIYENKVFTYDRFSIFPKIFNNVLYNNISPEILPISVIKDDSKILTNAAEFHRLICDISSFERKGRKYKILYKDISCRIYNSNMEFVNIKTENCSGAKKVTSFKDNSTENMDKLIVLMYDVYSDCIKLSQNYGISLSRNINIKKDLYEYIDEMGEVHYLFKDISLFEYSDDKYNLNCILAKFVYDILEMNSNYEIKDGKVIFKNYSLVNYSNVECLAHFEKYLIDHEIDNKVVEMFLTLNFHAISFNLRQFPRINSYSIENFLEEKGHLQDGIYFKDEYIINIPPINCFYERNLRYIKFKPIKAIVYDSCKKIIGSIFSLPVQSIKLFSDEFFEKFDEKQIIQILILFYNKVVLHQGSNNRVCSSYKSSEKINQDYIIDNKLGIYCTSLTRDTTTLDHISFQNLVLSVIEEKRRRSKKVGTILPINYLNHSSRILKDSDVCSFLEKYYSILSVYDEKLKIWYDGNKENLISNLFSNDIILENKEYDNILFKDKYNTVVQLSEGILINIVNMENIDISSVNNLSLKFVRDSENYEIIGYVIDKNDIFKFDEEVGALENVHKDNVKTFLKCYIKMLEYLNAQLNDKKNNILFENLNSINYNISSMFITFKNKMLLSCLCFFKLKEAAVNIAEIDYEAEKCNILDAALNLLITREESKEYFEYILGKDFFSQEMISKYDITEIISILKKALDNSKLCLVHNIHYNSTMYNFCPKCAENMPDNYIVVDKDEFTDTMKKGGEALIFEANSDVLYKMYRKNSKGQYIVNIENKMNIISAWLEVKDRVYKELEEENFSMILPDIPLLDKENLTFCGFSLKKVKDSKPISVLMDIEYAQKENLRYIDILKILINLGNSLKYLDKNNWYIGDFNGGNILFDKNYHVYMIDTDSLGGIASNEPVAFVGSFLDPTVEITNGKVKTSITTDYYSYALISFAALTGIHPFGGIYKENGKIINQMDRMKRGISVLGNHKINLPSTIFEWDWMSEKLKSKFLSIFEKQNRENILPYLEEELSILNKSAEDTTDTDEKDSNIAKLKVIFDGQNIEGIQSIKNTSVFLMDNNKFYDFNKNKVITLNFDIIRNEKIYDIWLTSDNKYYFVITDRNIIFLNSLNYKVKERVAIDDAQKIRHSYSGNKIFIFTSDNVVRVIRYFKTEEKLQYIQKQTIYEKICKEGKIETFYISKEGSVIMFVLTSQKDKSNKLFFFDVDENKCINSVKVKLDPFYDSNLKVFFDYSGEDNILLYNPTSKKYTYFNYSSETIKISYNNIHDIDYNANLYNGILYYPVVGNIGAINLKTQNTKKFECKICSNDCKITRVPNGFIIISKDSKKIYSFFA